MSVNYSLAVPKNCLSLCFCYSAFPDPTAGCTIKLSTLMNPSDRHDLCSYTWVSFLEQKWAGWLLHDLKGSIGGGIWGVVGKLWLSLPIEVLWSTSFLDHTHTFFRRIHSMSFFCSVMFLPTGTQDARQPFLSGLYPTRCQPNYYDENLSFTNTWPTVQYVFRASDRVKNFAFLVSWCIGTLLFTHYFRRIVSIFMAQRPNTDKILTLVSVYV